MSYTPSKKLNQFFEKLKVSEDQEEKPFSKDENEDNRKCTPEQCSRLSHLLLEHRSIKLSHFKSKVKSRVVRNLSSEIKSYMSSENNLGVVPFDDEIFQEPFIYKMTSIIEEGKLVDSSNLAARSPDLDDSENVIPSTDEEIDRAIEKSLRHTDLIGDFSRSTCLSLIKGRHQDLNTIPSEAMAKLLNGEFSQIIESFIVIDCRYPYEYTGGHIQGAVNFYTNKQILDLFNSAQTVSADARRTNILIFYCEFSSKRSPDLYRFLRKKDRFLHENVYPTLKYPEIYLLEGGYKDFFENYPHLCDPRGYKKMLDAESKNEMSYYKSQVKNDSW